MLFRENDLTKKVQKLLWWSLDSCAVLWQKFRENNVFTTFDLTKYFSGQSNFSFSALFCKAVKCGKNKYFVKSIFVIILSRNFQLKLSSIDLTKKSGTISFPYSFKTLNSTRPFFSTQSLNHFDEFFPQIIVSSIDCHTTTFSAAFRP